MSIEPGTPIRRIVTGHNEDNQAIFAADGPLTRVFDNLGQEGLVFHEVWNTQQSPARIDRDNDEPREERLTLSPPKAGARIRVLDIPPEKAGADYEAVFDNIAGKDAHVGEATQRHASFHRTQSIDYGIVLSGEITLQLDIGETVVRAGDIVVQRGTNHGWINNGDKPCRIAFILIDGVFEDGLA